MTNPNICFFKYFWCKSHQELFLKYCILDLLFNKPNFLGGSHQNQLQGGEGRGKARGGDRR